ncbi:MAG: hypothetical protein ACYDHH_00185 [Solirubrobacteraceae bacterium]
MDEAFVPLHEMIVGMAATGDIRSERAGIHMYIHRFSVESPIELDLSRDASGSLRLGTVPPLYRVTTSYRPSYHQIRFTAELTPGQDPPARAAPAMLGELTTPDEIPDRA